MDNNNEPSVKLFRTVPYGSRANRDGDPTPEEIRAMCLQIRRENLERKAAGGSAAEVRFTPRIFHVQRASNYSRAMHRRVCEGSGEF